MARSEAALQAFHLSQALYGLGAPAARALAAAPQKGPRRGDGIWAYGRFLEAAGWLCLGSDLGYFPRRETAEVLRSLLTMKAAQKVPEEARELVVGNDWAELLAAGDIEQAFEVRLFRDEPEEARALQPAFQTAWSFAAGLAASGPADAFQKALLVLDDNRWDDDIRAAAEVLDRALRSREGAVWRQLAEREHLLDGLIATLHHLQVLAAWAYSTAEPGSSSKGLAPDERVGGAPAESPARRLVLAAGKLLRWRLDLAHQQVQRRLDEAVDLAADLLPDLMSVLGSDIEEAWPEGFRGAMENALADWRDITGGAATRGRPAPTSESGSGGVAVGTADADVAVEVEAGVSFY